MLKLFDSHAHLDSDSFDEDRDEVIKESLEKLAGFLNPGCDIPTSEFAVNLAGNYDNVYAAVGFHPHEAKEMLSGDEDKLLDFAKNKKVVAIGEIGLDYYYDHSPRDVQKQVFIRHIELARALDLPIIIHDRDAHADTMSIVKEHAKGLKGVFHCYSGSWEMAKEILKLGFYVSFGGSLTFKNAVKTVEVAKNIPIENVILETDSPYLTPVPFRGKRNNPMMVEYVCRKFSEIRDIDYDEVANITTNNVYKLFNIKKDR